MKSFNLTQWIIIIILSLLTALEPLSIDLYLPGFIMISDAFNAPISSVQMSLTTFLAGFAVGQLFWGPLADKMGRKKPIMISLFIFIIASILCMYVKTIEQLWVIRFIQAIGGCGGIVISRAVVTDYFDKEKTLKIFSLLALIMGVAPIIAPTIGNAVLKLFSWKGLFGTMIFLGILLLLLTIFFLPETHKKRNSVSSGNIINNYWQILKDRKFLTYAIISGIANGALMIYVANGPFLIMDYGGFSSNMFSIVFAVNAMGLMIGSYLINVLQRFVSVERLVKLSSVFMFFMSIALVLVMYINANIFVILGLLFFYIFPIGILFPATVEIAMVPFVNNSGTASALFGSIQLLVAFICSLVSNFISNGSILTIAISFFFCGLIGIGVLFLGMGTKKEQGKLILSKERIKISK